MCKIVSFFPSGNSKSNLASLAAHRSGIADSLTHRGNQSSFIDLVIIDSCDPPV